MTLNEHPQRNNIQFDATPHMQEICSPLKFLGIHSFVYMKRYANGEFVDLFTDPLWAEFSLLRLFESEYKNDTLTHHFHCMSKDISLWNIDNNQPVWLEAKQHFGYHSGISINSPGENCQETFCFYSYKPHRAIEEIDMQYIEALKYFSAYFKTRAKPLISNAEKNMLKVPTLYMPQPISTHSARLPTYNIHQFFDNLQTNKLEINGVTLTLREIECICWLSAGKSAEEIGKLLSLSNRTIEKHLNSVKQKLNCYKITQIIQICQNSAMKFLLDNWNYK